MKMKRLSIVITLAILMTHSCNEPETVVTNIVHPDGSVTRKIEMKSTENNFDPYDIQVPLDSTWNIRDSLEITEDNDTIWIKRAEKLFSNVSEINLAYQTDSGVNKDITRRAEFSRKFRWFNTRIRFSEIVDQLLENGYPLSDFLNKEELLWFYSPENIRDNRRHGPDSLACKALRPSSGL